MGAQSTLYKVILCSQISAYEGEVEQPASACLRSCKIFWELSGKAGAVEKSVQHIQFPKRLRVTYLHSVDSRRSVLEQSHASDRGRVPRGGASLSLLPGQGRPVIGASDSTGHHAMLPSSCTPKAAPQHFGILCVSWMPNQASRRFAYFC